MTFILKSYLKKKESLISLYKSGSIIFNNGGFNS